MKKKRNAVTWKKRRECLRDLKNGLVYKKLETTALMKYSQKMGKYWSKLQWEYLPTYSDTKRACQKPLFSYDSLKVHLNMYPEIVLLLLYRDVDVSRDTYQQMHLPSHFAPVNTSLSYCGRFDENVQFVVSLKQWHFCLLLAQMRIFYNKWHGSYFCQLEVKLKQRCFL